MSTLRRWLPLIRRRRHGFLHERNDRTPERRGDSHGNLCAMTACFLTDVETIAPGDAIIHAAPLSHGSGLYAVPHVARGAVHVVTESGGFEADETLRLLTAWDRAARLCRADDG
jgi:hypothetical protein